jgi:hypothetical protein
VAATIDFDDQPRGGHREVRHEFPDDHLTLDLDAELGAAKQPRHRLLAPGGSGPHGMSPSFEELTAGVVSMHEVLLTRQHPRGAMMPCRKRADYEARMHGAMRSAGAPWSCRASVPRRRTQSRKDAPPPSARSAGPGLLSLHPSRIDVSCCFPPGKPARAPVRRGQAARSRAKRGEQRPGEAGRDDKKDAGEIGADHTVTALYEIVPAGGTPTGPGTDPLKYQAPGAPNGKAVRGELGTVKLRYKLPSGSESQLMEVAVRDADAKESDDFRFAAAVAELGMLLRDSPHKGSSSYADAARLASSGELDERRREFVELVRTAERLGK